MKGFFLAILALVVSCAATAKPPTVELDCGRVTGFRTVAERQFLSAESGGGNIYNVNVTFTGKKPTNAQAEAALRDCLAKASKMDGSKDMLASAWLKPRIGAPDGEDDLLSPFGSMRYLGYKASTKKVSVEPIVLTRK
jgi:hypothetical protein